jgi:hypothetical protein
MWCHVPALPSLVYRLVSTPITLLYERKCRLGRRQKHHVLLILLRLQMAAREVHARVKWCHVLRSKKTWSKTAESKCESDTCLFSATLRPPFPDDSFSISSMPPNFSQSSNLIFYSNWGRHTEYNGFCPPPSEDSFSNSSSPANSFKYINQPLYSNWGRMSNAKEWNTRDIVLNVRGLILNLERNVR